MDKPRGGSGASGHGFRFRERYGFVQNTTLECHQADASNALAVSDHSAKDYRKRRLIRFVQNPAEKKIPEGVRFLLYLNPIRPNYELPQCRFEHDQTQLDVVRQISTVLIAEIAVPPFGVALLSGSGHRLAPHLLPLLDIGYFGDYSLDEFAVVSLDLPIRTVFGPAALRFWQDATQENVFDTPSP